MPSRSPKAPLRHLRRPTIKAIAAIGEGNPRKPSCSGSGVMRSGTAAASHRPPPVQPKGSFVPMCHTVTGVVRYLAQHAEMVCRHYLCNGRRTGRYWQVGDVFNTPGQSLYVHLSGSRAGKWRDAATGEHGDLLDLIALNQHLSPLKAVLCEASRFLALPWEMQSEHSPSLPAHGLCRVPRRIFAAARPITGTIVEAYLRHRGIDLTPDLPALRFHPTCAYRAHDTAPREAHPALIAAVTDLSGRISGIERTWLDASGSGKAPIPKPRRALGSLFGNCVRFGTCGPVLLAGEGVETVLSIKCVIPTMPMVAALSSSRLASLLLPRGLLRLYVACDADAAGQSAFARLAGRAQTEGFEALPLRPTYGDFNDDLRALGPAALAAVLRPQIAAPDQHLLDPGQGRHNTHDSARAEVG